MRIRYFTSNRLANERGIAALTVVLLGVVLVGIIALSFLARTETKQYGSALTSTGNNAFMTAEAGLRYTEKCLLNNDPNCPVVTANTDWTNLTTGFTKTFGSGNGQFAITFAPIDASTVVVTSVGTFRGSSREVSKTIAQLGACKFTDNVITACQNVNIHPQATVNGSVETGFCPAPALVDPLTFPGNPGGCPNIDYPAFVNGVPPLAAPYQYCSWTHALGGLTLNGPATVWVAGNFDMSGNSTLTINGDVTINVGGTVTLQNNAEIVVNGTLTLHSTGAFLMQNQSMINNTGGDPADVIVLAEGTADLNDDAVFNGGIISNDKITMDQDAVFTGAVIGNMVQIKRRPTVSHDASAGSNATGYPECSP